MQRFRFQTRDSNYYMYLTEKVFCWKLLYDQNFLKNFLKYFRLRLREIQWCLFVTLLDFEHIKI